MYLSTIQASHESRALQLAITVGRLAKYDSTVLEATWLLCRLFNRNMQPHITTAIVEDTESWVGNLGKLAQKDALKCKPYVDIQGAHAEALLLQNKVSLLFFSPKLSHLKGRKPMSSNCPILTNAGKKASWSVTPGWTCIISSYGGVPLELTCR